MAQLPIQQQLVVELLKETVSLRTALHKIKRAIPGTYRRQPRRQHTGSLTTYTPLHYINEAGSLEIGVYDDGQVFWQDEYQSIDSIQINNHDELDQAIEYYLHCNRSADFDCDYEELQDRLNPLLDEYNILDQSLYQWSLDDTNQYRWYSNWDAYGSDTFYIDGHIDINIYDNCGLTWASIAINSDTFLGFTKEIIVADYDDIIRFIQDYQPEIEEARDAYHDHCIQCIYDDDEFIQSA